ncbi:phage tail tip lysozyme [Tetragenococcus halophilus]|uniref:phage tail tip lysozyme n=1 Tax=Tetragenococcus halophilus TaxID=51669 RepID=UPI00300FE997
MLGLFGDLADKLFKDNSEKNQKDNKILSKQIHDIGEEESKYASKYRDPIEAFKEKKLLSKLEKDNDKDSDVGKGGYPEGLDKKDRNAWDVWYWLTTHDYSKAAAAGILGNMKEESGVTPDKEQMSGPAYGLVQWDGSTEGYSGRDYVKKLLKDAGISGDYTKLEVQMELIDVGVGGKGSSKKGNRWQGTSPVSASEFKKLSSPEKAANVFERNFERPAAAHPTREKYAREYYDKFKDLKASSDGGGGGGNLDDKQKKLMKELEKHLGVSYVWGGRTPSVGFDCSGLCQYVYKTALDFDPGPTTIPQESCGKGVSMDKLQAGDLVFWGVHGASHHVAMMTSSSAYIQAPKPGDVVRRTKISEYTPKFAVRPKPMAK